MKLLFDQHLSFKLCRQLADLFPELIWLRCGNQRTDVIENLLRTHAESIAAFEGGSAACLEIY